MVNINAIANVMVRHMGAGTTVLLLTDIDGKQTLAATTMPPDQVIADYRDKGLDVAIIVDRDCPK